MTDISRRNFLAGAAASAGAGSAALAAAGAPTNVIWIVVDTWSTKWLGCYGNKTIRTPNVDGLAARSAVFQDAYPDGLPTVPARRAMYTGRQVFPSETWLTWQSPMLAGWHPLFVEDVTIAEELGNAGFKRTLVTDVYHGFKPGFNLHRGFGSWRITRGQECDLYENAPTRGLDVRPYLHASQTAGTGIPALVMRYLMNRKSWTTEQDWPVYRLFRDAAEWLEKTYQDAQPFYLHIESYSPHEFWDPPEDYYRLYMKSNYSGPRLIQAPGDASLLTPVELEHVNALYAGMVTFVDSCIGRFLEQVERLGLMTNTMIVFTADHGTQTGEHGEIHKHEGALRAPVTNVPLLIYLPGENLGGRGVRGLVSHIDIAPTILDILGRPIPTRVTGESVKNSLWSGQVPKREFLVTGWGDHGSIRTPEFNYVGRWNPGDAYEQLYDLRQDPQELDNLLESKTSQVMSLIKDYRTILSSWVEDCWQITRGSLAQKTAGAPDLTSPTPTSARSPGRPS
jgi:arylsulfatase A-like enzyme